MQMRGMGPSAARRSVLGLLLFAALFAHNCWADQQEATLDDYSYEDAHVEAGASRGASSKEVAEGSARPFLALRNPAAAASRDVQRLYRQGASAASVAYLLFAAAEPLAQAEGSSAALLPYLSPVVLRLYTTQQERCSTDLVRRLYEVSVSLYGTESLKACHFSLYQALRSTFSWVRDNIPLRTQALPGQPDALAAWPDLDLTTHAEMLMAVAAAAADDDQLGGVAGLLEGSCGLAVEDYAAMVPQISAVLADLHADLPMLQQIAMELHESHWTPESSPGATATLFARGGGVGGDVEVEGGSEGGGGEGEELGLGLGDSPVGARRRAALEAWQKWVRGGGAGAGGSSAGSDGDDAAGEVQQHAGQEEHEEQQQLPEAHGELMPGTEGLDNEGDGDDVAGAAAAAAAGMGAVTRRRRRLAATVPANFFYTMPPGGFAVAAPASLPKVSYPMVFHIMLYTDTDGTTIAPTKYSQSSAFVDRLVRVANHMVKPANIQFYVKEVRNNAATHPYLLLPNRSAWLTCHSGGTSGAACLRNTTFLNSVVVDFPRSMNIFIASDSTAGAGVPLGYAWVPASDVFPDQGHVFMTWDGVSVDGFNSAAAYNDGSNTLVHEALHHLGLHHTFNTANSGAASCNDDDYVIDTPTAFGSASGSSFSSTATAYCMEQFWGVNGGDWEAAYARWASGLGIPDSDRNAWADSCPSRAGYDELGNYMTYSTAVCFAALGHMTTGQAHRAHFITAELNPLMYAWGQYYAANAAPPPPAASPPPESYTNICKATRNNCACLASWKIGSTSYSFCDRTGSSNALTCEVADSATCADCASVVGPCILSCTGTARQCKKPPAPGSIMPPPPPPRPPSPPPMPPPPPPRAVPAACKKSASGCDCRSTWISNNYFASYCAAPDNSAVLWCQVDPSCPSFTTDSPYEKCARNLTAAFCGGNLVKFSTSTTGPEPLWPPPPPSPPSPPPAPPPRPMPPAPSTGAVARTAAMLVISASCNLLRPDATVALDDVVVEIAAAAQVPEGFISVTGMACSPSNPTLLLANYTVFFPGDFTAQQVGNTTRVLGSTAAMKAAVSASFQSRWGAVTQAAAGGTAVLQRATLVASGPYYVLRLPSYSSGLVQVLLPDGSIGLICTATPFGAAEATTVCRSLGFSTGVPATPPASVATDSSYASSLLLDGLSCESAAATRLEQCTSTGWVVAGSRCTRSTVAAVTCTGGVLASLDANVTLNSTDCAAASGLSSGQLLSELLKEQAERVYKVDLSRLVLRSQPSCVVAGGVAQLPVSFSLQFPDGSKAAEVDAAQDATTPAAVRAGLTSQLQARWGPVVDASAPNAYVVDSNALCADGSATTRVCASAVSEEERSGLNKYLVGPITYGMAIGIGVAILVALALLAVLAVFMWRRRSASVEPAGHTATTAWARGASTSSNAVSAAPVSNTVVSRLIASSRVSPLPVESVHSEADLSRPPTGARAAAEAAETTARTRDAGRATSRNLSGNLSANASRHASDSGNGSGNRASQVRLPVVHALASGNGSDDSDTDSPTAASVPEPPVRRGGLSSDGRLTLGNVGGSGTGPSGGAGRQESESEMLGPASRAHGGLAPLAPPTGGALRPVGIAELRPAEPQGRRTLPPLSGMGSPGGLRDSASLLSESPCTDQPPRRLLL